MCGRTETYGSIFKFSCSQASRIGRNRNFGRNINTTFLSVLIFQEKSWSFRLDNAIPLYVLVDFNGLVWCKGQNCLIILQWELNKKWLRPSLYLSCSKDYSANPEMVVMTTNSWICAVRQLLYCCPPKIARQLVGNIDLNHLIIE